MLSELDSMNLSSLSTSSSSMDEFSAPLDKVIRLEVSPLEGKKKGRRRAKRNKTDKKISKSQMYEIIQQQSMQIAKMLENQKVQERNLRIQDGRMAFLEQENMQQKKTLQINKEILQSNEQRLELLKKRTLA